MLWSEMAENDAWGEPWSSPMCCTTYLIFFISLCIHETVEWGLMVTTNVDLHVDNDVYYRPRWVMILESSNVTV